LARGKGRVGEIKIKKMNSNIKPTTPGKGYTDGIKSFYEEGEMAALLMNVINKQFPNDDLLVGRAYLVIKELPDAKIGTILRPAINWETGELTEEKFGKNHYIYASKYVSRQSVLHMEVVHHEKDWFCRIN